MNKKKPIILAVAILLAIMTAVSASTFAWFTAQDDVVNRIQTASLTDGDVSIIEAFDPEVPLLPGVGINKDVGAINTGDAPALVRISFSEVLKKLLPMPGTLDEARAQDMRVRDGEKFTDLPTAPELFSANGYAADQVGFIPQLVDISKFEADAAAIAADPTGTATNTGLWRPISTFASYTGYALFDTTSTANLATLTSTLGITIQYKQVPNTLPNTSKKYQFAAYAALGTNPETYQNVELRQELLNIVCTDSTAPATYKLKVTLVDPNKANGPLDPVAPALYNNASGYYTSGPKAKGNNGDGRFYNFISLQLDNNGTARTADWRAKTTTAVSPVGDTHPLAADYAAGKMPAVTNKGNTYTEALVTKYFLELMFHDGYVAATPTANKWYYNAGDGFFYYCGIVEPGESTPLLLDAIMLSGAAEGDYSHVKFDLTVHMDAIQATAEAVTSTVGGGWGANTYGGTPLNNTAGTIGKFLIDLCA